MTKEEEMKAKKIKELKIKKAKEEKEAAEAKAKKEKEAKAKKEKEAKLKKESYIGDNIDRFLTEDAVTEYYRAENLDEKFQSLYNMFVEDEQTFTNNMKQLSNKEFAGFMVYVLESMRIEPLELARTLKSVID